MGLWKHLGIWLSGIGGGGGPGNDENWFHHTSNSLDMNFTSIKKHETTICQFFYVRVKEYWCASSVCDRFFGIVCSGSSAWDVSLEKFRLGSPA